MKSEMVLTYQLCSRLCVNGTFCRMITRAVDAAAQDKHCLPTIVPTSGVGGAFYLSARLEGDSVKIATGS